MKAAYEEHAHHLSTAAQRGQPKAGGIRPESRPHRLRRHAGFLLPALQSLKPAREESHLPQPRRRRWRQSTSPSNGRQWATLDYAFKFGFYHMEIPRSDLALPPANCQCLLTEADRLDSHRPTCPFPSIVLRTGPSPAATMAAVEWSADCSSMTPCARVTPRDRALDAGNGWLGTVFCVGGYQRIFPWGKPGGLKLMDTYRGMAAAGGKPVKFAMARTMGRSPVMRKVRLPSAERGTDAAMLSPVGCLICCWSDGQSLELKHRLGVLICSSL